MSTRILPLLALLPALAACTEVVVPATPEAQAPAVTQAATPVARPAAVAPATVTPASTLAAPAARVPSPPASALAPPPSATSAAVAPAAPRPAAATGRLGTTVASLGTPSPGLWLETALVEAPTRGRIEYNGQSVAVELRPSGGEPGSGSEISLEAMRAIGAPLTGLPELTVFGG